MYSVTGTETSTQMQLRSTYISLHSQRLLLETEAPISAQVTASDYVNWFSSKTLKNT